MVCDAFRVIIVWGLVDTLKFWGLSPYYMNSSNANVFNANDNMNNNNVNNTNGVRPVISLSAEYCENLQGDGSMTNPYKAP